MEICKATIVFEDSKITFEGSAEFVQSQVEKFTSRPRSGPLPETATRDTLSQDSVEKQLISEKRPRGHHEVVTVLAFALSETGLSEFGEDEVRRAYLRAGVRPPKHVAQALRDAKSKFDYIEAGSKRGTYRLSNHGDRVVRFDLPRLSG